MNTRQVAKAGEKPAQAVGAAITPPPKQSLVRQFAARLGVEPEGLMQTLKDTCFKQRPGRDNKPAIEVNNSQMMALLVVANEYGLNPFLKEIYAFPNKAGGIEPIVGYDGWIRLVQSQPTFKGEELVDGWDERLGKDGNPRGFYYDCTMHRSDRDVPTKIREYHNENWRDTDPWNNMPNRMTRMRAYIQCARVAFGFGGIHDPDEGERIADAMAIDSTATPISTKPATVAPRAKIAHTPAETARANFVETAQAQPETVTAHSPKDAVADENGEFKSLASEPEQEDSEEAGTRG